MNENIIVTAHFNVEAHCGQPVNTEMTVGESHISDQVKQSIVSWTKQLLKLNSTDFRVFPSLWTDGVYLCRLVKLIFKISDFKYFDKQPLSRTQTRINLKKVFIELRKRAKFKSNYLFSENQVSKGIEGTIWGLLFDLKNYALGEESILSPCSLLLSEEVLRQQIESSTTYSCASLASSQSACKPSQVTINHIREVKIWLGKLGLSDLAQIDNGHFFQNPYKNGLILSEVLKILGHPLDFNEEANSKAEVLQNINNCLIALKSFPGVLTTNINPLSILHGSEEATWGLLLSLSQLFPYPIKPSLSLYNTYQRSDLTASLRKWLASLKLAISPHTNIASIEILFEATQQICKCSKDNTLETLKAIFHLDFLFHSDFDESDICLLFLENLHRYCDSYPLQLERNYTCSVYLGRGLTL